MEWWHYLVIGLVILAILNTERQANAIRQDVQRLDARLNRLLAQIGLTSEGWRRALPFDYPAIVRTCSVRTL